MTLQATGTDLTDTAILKVAVLAVGGQGGGVLSNWIAELAHRGGYAAQMTSVAGVAQRTGATIYYIEMAPKSDRMPVFALSPSPGDVDVLIAAELMEAGRAVLRGFVTPDRTTIIASSHRVLAVSEKETPGDGRSDGSLVTEEITRAALHTVCFDFETLAAQSGSMISASLFGGLARSGALPFPQALYEAVIADAGRGVDQSLAAFRAAVGFSPPPPAPKQATQITAVGPKALLAAWGQLAERVDRFPSQTQDMIHAGLRKVVDYQDLAYGKAYLDHLMRFSALDRGDMQLTVAAAKYVANAMCYDDLPRVADLKVRRSRGARLRREQQIDADAVAHVTEFFHPRALEVCGTLPAGLGRAIENRKWAFDLLDKMVNRGRRLRTDGVVGFGLLWLVSMVRPYRRRLLRHQVEAAHLDALIAQSVTLAPNHYDLSVEVLRCQRLIKGYSDTHQRGQSKFAKVLSMLPTLQGRSDGAEWLARLRTAALSDEDGAALEGAIQTIKSFA